MHKNERNALLKLQTVLLLASSDMDQAAAAARTLEAETDGVLARALETAMAVCYMRAFTTSSLMTLPNQFVPTTSPDAELHARLRDLRDKVYAHTDRASGRSASMKISGVDGDVVSLEWREEWMPFPREAIPSVVALFERHRDLCRTEAGRLQVRLDATEATS
jgi:hypothetical protein